MSEVVDTAFQTIEGYRQGTQVFDAAFRLAHAALVAESGDPDLAQEFDDKFGVITVQNIEGSHRSYSPIVTGSTEHSPTSNFGNHIEPDVRVWRPSQPAVVPDGEQFNLFSSSCGPINRFYLARMVLSRYDAGWLPFGTAFRAAYVAFENLKAAGPGDLITQKRHELDQTLGRVAFIGGVPFPLQDGRSEFGVFSRVSRSITPRPNWIRPDAVICVPAGDPRVRRGGLHEDRVEFVPAIDHGPLLPLAEGFTPHPDAHLDNLYNFGAEPTGISVHQSHFVFGQGKLAAKS